VDDVQLFLVDALLARFRAVAFTGVVTGHDGGDGDHDFGRDESIYTLLFIECIVIVQKRRSTLIATGPVQGSRSFTSRRSRPQVDYSGIQNHFNRVTQGNIPALDFRIAANKIQKVW
jgi:hypothetical protein